MAIIVCGINHKTAPLELREKLFFSVENLNYYLQDILSNEIAEEAVLLSTCNRTEVYCEAHDFIKIKEWFIQQAKSAHLESQLNDAIYVYQGQIAVEHIIKVACGLDSMILGEPEILGQVKTAYSESCTANAVNSIFHRLFQYVFATAKEIRSSTMIGACPVSVASTTLNLAKKLLPQFNQSNVLLMGAGDTIELVLRYLKNDQPNLWIANRNYEKALKLANEYEGHALSLSEIQTILPEMDIIISATGSLEPILKKADLIRQVKALYIFDIAVPRDVDPDVAELDQVKLYCIDDLTAIIQENQSHRIHAAEKAHEVIRNKSEEFMMIRSSHDQVSETIRAYREKIEAICEMELRKALTELAQNPNAEEVLRQFAYAVTNKLLHAPSIQLRQAGVEGRQDLLRLAKELLSIPETQSAA